MSLTDLIEVSVRGDLESLQELLDQESLNLEDQSIINLRNKQGKSALDMAAMLGNLQIVQELIARGADFNSSTDSGRNLYHNPGVSYAQFSRCRHDSTIKIDVDSRVLDPYHLSAS